jgi:hypothetical protein
MCSTVHGFEICIAAGQAEKFAWQRRESNPRLLGALGYQVMIIEHTDIEGTRFSSEISPTRTDLTA